MIKQLTSEERANVWTHLPGVIASLALIYPLLRLSLLHDWTYVLGTVLFLVGMLDMYLSSTLYHLILPGKAKRVLRVFDHCAIYVMISGCYSLICVSVLGGWIGWTLFIFLWLCVVAGIVGKTIALGKYPKLSLTLYLVMGWVALLVIWPLWKALPHAAFFFIVGEGVMYSIGAYFFSKDEQHAFFHAIWHVFILLGSLCHTIATFLILTP